MGLLDDAIREHLDLKRRRGADPTEIARLEQEALGPVRREPEPVTHEQEPPREPAHHGAVADEPSHEELHEEAATPAQEERLFEAPEPAPAPAPGADAAPAEPEPASEPVQPQSDDLLHQPTSEYRVDEHLDEEEHADEPVAAHEPDEDVLEETPDFLQETPEHDRLWFEQRPPRDFDFDG
jgi:hypothetical protein